MLLPHPAAEDWPMLDDGRFAELKEDIRVRGQRVEIVLCDGMILDGRNRYKAVLELKAEGVEIEPLTKQYPTDQNPYDEVLTLNGKRRDINEVQRAICVKDNRKHSVEWAAQWKAAEDRVKEAQRLRLSEAMVRARNTTANSEGSAQEVRELHASTIARFPPPPPAVVSQFPPPPYLPPPPLPAPEPVRDRVAEEAHTTRTALAEVAGVGRKAMETEARLDRHDKEHGTNLRAQVKQGLPVVEAIREINKSKLAEKIAFVPPVGKFGTIIIDPPWQMEKIEREVAPDQVGFDYPTMSLDELAVFPVGDMAADNCHLFCWTTQKLLPATFDLLTKWGFKYVLTMVWHKPGGFQPFNLPQYNCEFIVYGRRGSVVFADTKAFNCCFSAPRREHSRKPDEFYDLIRRVTPENARRIDVFSREQRDGFEQYGNEVDKFSGAA